MVDEQPGSALMVSGAGRFSRRITTAAASIASLPRRSPLTALAIAVVIALTVVAVFAPLVAPHDPLALHRSDRLLAPGRAYLLGTDQTGRDELSRLIYGARVSLWVGVAPIALAIAAGGGIGLASAYAGGLFDTALQRVMDGAMAFPPLILLLVVVSLMGVSLTAIVLALSFVFLPMINRVARASTLSVMALPFIESAHSVGASPARIMVRYVVPNIAAPVVVVGTSLIGTAILAEASLSFLGFGLAPPQPTWGNMLSGDNRDIFQVAPWLAISPGVAIALTVLAFNLICDGLRDALDPYSKGGRKR